MKLRKLMKRTLPVIAAGIFSTMTVFAATNTYTIENPVIVKDYPEDNVVRTTINMTMKAAPAAEMKLNVTPYYSLRGSTNLYQDTTKSISSSGSVSELTGSVDYSNHMASHKVYMKYVQEGYVLDSGEYSLVAEKTTY